MIRRSRTTERVRQARLNHLVQRANAVPEQDRPISLEQLHTRRTDLPSNYREQLAMPFGMRSTVGLLIHLAYTFPDLWIARMRPSTWRGVKRLRIEQRKSLAERDKRARQINDAHPHQPADRLPQVSPDDTVITWIWHNGTVIQTGGLTCVNDPLFHELPATPKSITLPGLRVEQLPPIDVVTFSHDHPDHLDERTIDQLISSGRIDPDTTDFLVPANLGDLFRERGLRCVTELQPNEAVVIERKRDDNKCSAAFTFLAARHNSGRALHGRYAPGVTPPGHWFIRANPQAGHDGAGIFVGGDTGFDPFLAARILRQCGPVDAAVVSAGSYAPRGLERHVHADPEENAAMVAAMQAAAVMPVHHRTFVFGREPIMEPWQRIRAAWRLLGMPEASFAGEFPGDQLKVSSDQVARRRAQPRNEPANHASAVRQQDGHPRPISPFQPR